MVVEVPGHQHVAIHPPCRPPAEERERERGIYIGGEGGREIYGGRRKK